MIQFENPYYLWLLCVIPILIAIAWLLSSWRKKTLSKYGEPAVVQQLFPEVSKTKRVWKQVLFILAILLMIIGVVNPQIGTKLQKSENKGADLMICLDVSNSMLAEDLEPNRLDKAKLAIARLIDELQGDRIGLIVFAGEAYVQLPITTDYAAAKMFLESVNTHLISSQGTAIGKAIELAIESFGKETGKNKAILIITDGENHEDNAIDIATEAAGKGIAIHTIGIGSEGGAPIPILKSNVHIGYRKDKEGNTVISKLNETMLQQIAAAGNGVYVRASNSSVGLNNVLNAIEQLEKKQYESKWYADYEDRFQWFIAPALFLLLIELLINEKKSKWVERLNFFGEENR